MNGGDNDIDSDDVKTDATVAGGDLSTAVATATTSISNNNSALSVDDAATGDNVVVVENTPSQASGLGIEGIDNDDIDDEPDFIRPDQVGIEYEEVLLEEEEAEGGDVPMTDDASDDDDDDENNNMNAGGGDDAVMRDADADDGDRDDDGASSVLKLRSHDGPVYAVSAATVASTSNSSSANHRTVVVISGGGDDKAYLHAIEYGCGGTAGFTASAAAASSSAPTTATATTLTTGASSVLLGYRHADSVSCAAHNLPYVGPDASKTPPLVAVAGYDGVVAVYDFYGYRHLQQQQQQQQQQERHSSDTGGSHSQQPQPPQQLSPPPVVQPPLFTLEGPSDVECMCFHPNGGTVLLVGSSSDGSVWMFHLLLRKCLQVFVGHRTGPVVAVAFTSPGGKQALSACADGTVRVWAPRTGACKHVFQFHAAETDEAQQQQQPPPGLTCMATNGGTDQQLIIVGSEDGTAHVCHTGTKKVVATLRHSEETTATSAEAAGMMVDDGEEDDAEETTAPLLSVEAVGFCPSYNPNWCATGGVDGVLKIWDLSVHGGHSCRHSCRTSDTDTDVAVDAAATVDEAVAESHQEQQSQKRFGGGITRLQWHPTLPIVFASTTNGAVHAWDARNGRLLRRYSSGSGRRNNTVNDMSIQFVDDVTSNGGNSSTSSSSSTAIIATGGDDHLVRVFRADV